MRAEDVIELLELEPHPEEGGFYRETYRAKSGFIPGAPFEGERPVGTARTLCSDLSLGHPQIVVPGGVWQRSRLREGGSFALLGTTMGPGFEFSDYESGTSALLESHPDHAQAIRGLLRTRSSSL